MADSLTIGVIATPLSLVIITVIQGVQRSREKKEDWARQDEVEKAKAKVAQDLVESTAAAAKATTDAAALLKESNEGAQRIAGQTQAKLDMLQNGQQVIHSLANSTLTMTMQSKLDGLRRELLLLEELGKDMEAIAVVKAQIDVLQKQLDERAAVQDSIGADKVAQAGLGPHVTETDVLRDAIHEATVPLVESAPPPTAPKET